MRGMVAILSMTLGLLAASGAAQGQWMRQWAQLSFNGLADSYGGPLLLPTTMPVSFVCGGKPASAIAWARTDGNKDMADRSEHTATWRDPGTGLKITADAVAYKSFDAVEWVGYLENTGTTDTPMIEGIQAMDVALEMRDAKAPLVLRQIAGDDCSERSFLPAERTIAAKQAVRFAPNGGRSSNGTFPFFNLQYQGRGLIVAIGWTGQWAASISRGETQTRLVAGMEQTHLVLHPGEKIRTPRILMMSYEGDWLAGQNQFRRLLLAHCSPRRQDKPARPYFASNCYDRYNSHPTWPSEAGQLDAVRFDQSVGIDVYWLDAAWFPGNFPNGVGNWIAKPKEFPRGLRPVSDACHQAGMRVAVWFEPERVAGGSEIARASRVRLRQQWWPVQAQRPHRPTMAHEPALETHRRIWHRYLSQRL